MKELYFKNFKMHFPVTAKLATSYKKTGMFDLVVKLSDGTSIVYNDTMHAIRKLPKDSLRMTEIECRREFGIRLRNLMMLRNVTQNELSLQTGIAQPLISKYITGKTTPSFYNADKIAKALRCSADEFRYTD